MVGKLVAARHQEPVGPLDSQWSLPTDTLVTAVLAVDRGLALVLVLHRVNVASGASVTPLIALIGLALVLWAFVVHRHYRLLPCARASI